MSDTPVFVISRKLGDLAPGVAVEVEPEVADRLGAFPEPALDDDEKDQTDG